jgi:hypothetical protein
MSVQEADKKTCLKDTGVNSLQLLYLLREYEMKEVVYLP